MSENLQSIKQRFGIIGNSPGLNYAISIAARVAPTNLTVQITGESGVGKEIFSTIIHQLSPRKHNKFIAVNCGAIPEGTIDSELFGHEKGSFTGAHEQRKGYFETVHGGTIFLDEVGELPLGTQARLLRVLETGEFIKVGSSKVQKTDVRVVAATNVNLMALIEKGKFREDLYYRLSTVPIEIPPLRERGEDVYLLFRKFCVDFAERNRIKPIKLTEDAKNLILKYSWPGNVRQLKNVAEQTTVLAKTQEIDALELEKFIPEVTTRNLPALQKNGSGPDSLSERELLYKMLFDMKKDIHDLKKFVFDISGDSVVSHPVEKDEWVEDISRLSNDHRETQKPIILRDEEVENSVNVEESLSIAEKEKELIIKALKKHNSKRRDAASDLGISERTLYRKIKEYEIEE
ncbi:MAG: sigma-54-dependent Fis family transcriptional regulator [Chitinophagales bacterium]|nr:sigma-54-dependent Fis family transcriptional regulator [Chitinophagales bacterium]